MLVQDYTMKRHDKEKMFLIRNKWGYCQHLQPRNPPQDTEEPRAIPTWI